MKLAIVIGRFILTGILLGITARHCSGWVLICLILIFVAIELLSFALGRVLEDVRKIKAQFTPRKDY